MMQRMSVLLGAVIFGMGSAAVADSTIQTLEQRVQNVRARTPSQRAAPKDSLQRKLAAIKALRAVEETRTSTCTVSQRTGFAGRYVIASDATGKACRIYDLSFPTLLGSFQRQSISQLPVEKFTARDYLNWVNGRYEEVYVKVNQLQGSFQPQRALNAGWVKDLRFRNTPGGVQAMKARTNGVLPASFTAADLDIGAFQMPERDRVRVKELFAEARALAGGGSPAILQAQEDFWMQVADKPETFLQKIKFDWNDARKVYDIILEGEFLPILGPVALVDFERPYKQAVETMVRGVLSSVLYNLAGLIPHPTVGAVVRIAVEDVFQFVDMMYEYQGNQFEQALRAGLAGQVPATVSPEILNRGLNVFFGGRSDLLTEYILAMAQGKPFRWEEMEKIGSISRYRAEKGREIMLRTANNRLVQVDGCQMERPWPYFGICTKGGKREALYSLMSQHSVLFWNLGSPVVHRYEFPAETLLKRSTSWLLSAGVRLFGAQISPQLTRTLSNELKKFSTAGLSDEAYLRSALYMQKRQTGALDQDSEKMLSWMYLQNINPFLPKTLEAEERVIARNAGLLNDN